jgi:hypothetical protein
VMMNCDRYFVEELQRQGYKLDYKTITDIYKKSRENPILLRKKARKFLEPGKFYAWDYDNSKYVEISREEYDRRYAEKMLRKGKANG